MNEQTEKSLDILQSNPITAHDITNTSMNTSLYNLAKSLLGYHLTLDNSIPQDTGCAEAISKILSLIGQNIPTGGIPGTASLYTWLKSNPAFEEVTEPNEGVIIISPTGMGNGHVEGHVGIFGGFNVQYNNDFGILSNDSNTGLFREQWSYSAWKQYYGGYGGLPVYMFNLV